jgi:predicted phosphodiesterase
MNEPVRILSDLHLGHRVSRISRVEALRPLIAGAGTVVFNGDTWQELDEPFREVAAEMLAGLQRVCADEGAEAVFLPGNHDPGWAGPGWVSLAEGRIVITHGDTLFPQGSPWKREILAAGNAIGGVWRRHPDAMIDFAGRAAVAREIALGYPSLEHPRTASLLRRVADAMFPPRRALRMLEAWSGRPAAAWRLLETYFPSAEVLVIGHFHRHGCWSSAGRLLIDTGSFTRPGKAHWVEWCDGWLRRGVIDEQGGLCRLGPTLDVWRLPVRA